ncbi:MAG: hypothetical protein KDA25_00150, partial [Phycisphaerales bacterium]|nr:hypothetical protein [Phycisphaerales bacterium]
MTTVTTTHHHRPRRMVALVALASTLALAVAALGQSRQIPAPPQSTAIVLHRGTIHPVSGDVIADGYIVFD